MLLILMKIKSKLILNRNNNFITEHFISGDFSPAEIIHKITKLLDLEFDEDGYLTNIKDDYISLVTYSGFVVDEYIRMLRKMERIEGLYESIFFYDEGTKKDYRITDFMERSKLVHFSIGELYTDLEIESSLRKHLKRNRGKE